MDIKAFREHTRMSQRQFAEYLGIPLGTIRNWEQGISSPPEYVISMIFTSLRRDKMINVETIKFMRMMDELAALTEDGIEPFKNATQENSSDKLFYDGTKQYENNSYPVVQDSCVIDDAGYEHHDIISYYDTDKSEYTVRVFFDEYTKPYVLVKLMESGTEFIAEEGDWYIIPCT